MHVGARHALLLQRKEPVQSLRMGVALCAQEYVKLHQRYLVKGEDVLNEWHMEKIRRRTGSGITLLHGPYLQPPERQARKKILTSF